MKNKKKWFFIGGAIVLLLILVIGITLSERNKGPNFEYYTIAKSDVVQEVSVTGKVKPAEAIDYAFETSGKVVAVNVNVGDKVTSGKVLASLNNSDAASSIAQASAGVDAARSMVAQYQAQLDAQNAKLNELKNGARPEDIETTQIKIDNAQKSIADAQTNLVNTQTKANNDLNQLLSDCANSASSAVNAGLSSLNTITDIQYAHFNSNDMDSNNLAGMKAQAVSSLVGGVDGGRWLFLNINSATGGARKSASDAAANPSEAGVAKALADVSDALNKIQLTLNIIPFDTTVLSAQDKSNINLERGNMAGQISIISAKINAIGTQKITNQNLITAAQAQINQANNNLDLANQEMVTKKAGASAEDIEAQEAAVNQIEASIATQNAQIRSAEASLGSASAMYSKTILTSTIDGTVTKVDVKAGQMASPSLPVISVMTDARFTMEADVPEADIAKVKIDNTASVTLDAYGSDVVFDAKVVKIDPAETVIDGVSTYKVSFEFTNDDERIKSGMTANITINTAKENSVLNIPQRDLIKKNSENFVLVSDDGKNTHEVKVDVGLIGSDGNVEILSGLKEGEKIVNPSSIKK